MSAFVVGKEHIDAMVSLALEGPSGNAVRPGYWPRPFAYYAGRDAETIGEWSELRREIRLEDADALGQMLWGTNALSVRTRYPDLYEGGDYPGPIGFSVEDDVYEYRYTSPRPRPTAVEGLKLIACFEYQSCEFDEWKNHAAHYFCETLKDALVTRLPGYEDAPWEWNGAKVPA